MEHAVRSSDRLSDFFATDAFMPHGMCYQWRPEILWLHVLSDCLIALAYFTIPLGIYIFVRRRPDIEDRSLIYLFSAFILLCGLTHAFTIYVIWNPLYGPEGLMKMATGLVSAATAITLWRRLPQALEIPTPAHYKATNEDLIRQIEARLEAEDELQRLNESLEQQVAERTRELERANQALRQFTSIASHDLKAPARQMRMFAQLSLEDRDNEEFVTESLQSIMEGAKRMQTLIDALRRFTSNAFAQPDKQTVNMSALISGIADRTRADTPSVEIDLHNMPDAYADPALLERVFQNLIDNAVKYTEPGASAQIEISGQVLSDSVEYAIADRGIGVRPEFAERIFEPLNRLHADQSMYEGDGIGLALVRAIINAHGGDIHLDTSYTNGARFVLTLPRVASNPAAA